MEARKVDLLRGYKLLRVTSTGLAPLFVEPRRRLVPGVWLEANMGLTPNGLKQRPGWHVLATPSAPHLSRSGRQMWEVQMDDVMSIERRPLAQGGVWFTARRIRLLRPVVEK